MITIFSSRTGSDAIYVFEALKSNQIQGHTLEDVGQVVSNNINSPLAKYCYENGINFHLIPKRPELRNYDELGIPGDDTILLMGYLRVLPAEFCHLHPDTYNLHPADILLFPQLKGLDPQKRAFEAGHSKVGCTIHHVVPEVDAGEISMVRNVYNTFNSLDEMYVSLGSLAKEMWVDFLKEKSW